MAFATLVVVMTLTFALPSDSKHHPDCYMKGVVFEAERHGVSTGRAVFAKVRANAGRGYDPSTGYFTAPAAGTYLFTVQGYYDSIHSITWDLFVDNRSGTKYVVKPIDLTKVSQEMVSLYATSLLRQQMVFVSNRSVTNLATFFSGWLVKYF